jgi:hypothetical protein
VAIVSDRTVVAGDAVDEPGALTLPLYLAVGLPLGAMHENKSVHGGIRFGGELHLIDPDRYILWAAALQARNRASILSLVNEGARDRAERHVQSLVEDGLVIRLEAPNSASTLLDTHRLLPTGEGLGNHANNEGACFIYGRIPGCQMRVDPILYNVWGASTTAASLREVIDVVAEAFERTYDEVASHVLANLPLMMRAGIVLVDLS